MQVKLVVVQGKPVGKEIVFRSPKFLIGRGTECHLRPNSEKVSRHHCLFTVVGDRVVLRDLGSTNGTQVNGQRIVDEVVLAPGDRIQVGPLAFQFQIEAARPIVSASPNVGAAAGLTTQETEEIEIGSWVRPANLDPVPARDATAAAAESAPRADNPAPKAEQETRTDIESSANAPPLRKLTAHG